MNKSFLGAIIFTIILAVFGGMLMFFYAKHKQQTTYTAERYVLVSHNVMDSQDKDYPVTNADLNMMSSYEDIAENKIIAENAKKYLSKKINKKYTADNISNSVSAKSKPQSLVLKISVKTGNEKNSVDIVNAVAKSFQNELPKLQPGAGEVHLLAKASNSSVETTTTPNKKKYFAVGVALGGLLGIVISFIAITWKKILNK
nr:chain-length determining protein [Limosilactobacillus fastidiosus]